VCVYFAPLAFRITNDTDLAIDYHPWCGK